MESFFFPLIPAVLAISFVALIALGVSAMHDARQSANRSAIVKRVYVYLVSFCTLLLASVALVWLLDLGLRSFVFTSADPTMGYYPSSPPTLYLTPKNTSVEPVGQFALQCENDCTLTEQEKQDIKNWETNYQQWKTNENSISAQRAQAMITPLSFLIIAGIVFVFHWRWLREDRGTMQESQNLTRATYFSAMSFVWLVAVVIAAGFFLNTLLRIAVPGTSTSRYGSMPLSLSGNDTQGVASIATCGEACGLSAETVVLAKEWQGDYEAWNTRQTDTSPLRDRHNNLSIELAFLLVSVPQFLLHFRSGWRKRQPPTQTV